MFTADIKFELGQEVYVITTEKRVMQNKKTCDMYLGVGRIVHRGYEATCPMCHGDKDIILDSQSLDVYIVDPNPHTITSMRFSISNDGQFLRYRISGNTSGGSIAEDMVFATKEEAIAACGRLNAEEEKI